MIVLKSIHPEASARTRKGHAYMGYSLTYYTHNVSVQ